MPFASKRLIQGSGWVAFTWKWSVSFSISASVTHLFSDNSILLLGEMFLHTITAWSYSNSDSQSSASLIWVWARGLGWGNCKTSPGTFKLEVLKKSLPRYEPPVLSASHMAWRWRKHAKERRDGRWREKHWALSYRRPRYIPALLPIWWQEPLNSHF